MNGKMSNISGHFMFLKQKNGKIVASILFAIVIFSIGISVILFLPSGDEPSQIYMSGILYIDGNPAPSNVNLSIIFPSDTLFIEDGTNETGHFSIDITDYIGESFEMRIFYNGEIYNATDEFGESIQIMVSQDTDDFLDIYVRTFKENDDSGGNDDDGGSGDSEGDDGDGSDDDSGGNDDDGGSGDSEGDDGDGSDDDSGGNDDGGSGDSEGDDDSGGNDEGDVTFLSVTKLISNETSSEWNDNKMVEYGETVQCNISVIYNVSNISEIHIVDLLPSGLNYTGNNATFNGNSLEPVVDVVNHSLCWNITNTSQVNTTFFIHYNVTVTERGRLENIVTVNVTKNNSDFISQQSMATVLVPGQLFFSKSVKSSSDEGWKQSTVAEINDTIRFNISLLYNGGDMLTDVHIVDTLPDGLFFQNNVNTSENDINLTIENDNKTIIWNVDMIDDNQTVFIEFDVYISDNGSFTNWATVSANESLGTFFYQSDSSSVTVIDPQQVFFRKTVKTMNETSWSNYVNVTAGGNVTYNITITPPKNKTIINLIITDTLPPSVEYIPNSSVFSYENHMAHVEPDNTIANRLVWNESIYPINSTLTIFYDCRINGSGILDNRANYSSVVCGDNTYLSGSDFARINVTAQPIELHVDINVPDSVYVGYYVELKATAIGGQSPYYYEWDLDNDSSFEIENETIVLRKWDSAGIYSVSVKVTDSNNDTCSNTVLINVTVEPLIVNAGGPYHTYLGESVLFSAYATGGLGNYTWHWDFGDGMFSSEEEPFHVYSHVGMYDVVLTITDERNMSMQDETTVSVSLPDTIPPEITIDSPTDFIYFKNRRIIPFFIPLIFGQVEINISALDNDSDIEYMQIFIDNQSMEKINGSIGNYTWDKMVFGKHVIRVVAVDIAGNEGIKEYTVWKFF